MDGVAPSWIVSVSASVNLPLHHEVQQFSSGIGSHGWSWKKGHKMVWWCGGTWTKKTTRLVLDIEKVNTQSTV